MRYWFLGATELRVPPLRYASVLMNNRTLDRLKAFEGLRPAFSAHVSWCEYGAPVKCAVARTVHSTLNLPRASRFLGMTRGGRLSHAVLVFGSDRAAGPSAPLRFGPNEQPYLGSAKSVGRASP